MVSDIITRARQAAVPVFWQGMDKAEAAGARLDAEDKRERRIAIQESRRSADAAMRSLLTDLRARVTRMSVSLGDVDSLEQYVDELLGELQPGDPKGAPR